MNDCNRPDMSVVLVTPDRYDTIRQTINHLKAQTVRRRLEIVIVTPSLEGLHFDKAELSGFFQSCIVEFGEIKSIGEGNAAGVRRASAPIVALGEDHSYPDPRWAEALIRAHQNPWVAVGPEVRNGNPQTAISWADFFIGYGPWMASATAGEVILLPGHNSSYKRDVLLAYGPELEVLMEAESVLHWDLRSKGYPLYLEPEAKISHLNFACFSSWTQAQFHSSRVFAATRARRWTMLQRILYTCAAPLIPLVRFRRILRQVRRSACHPKPHTLPMVFLGLVVSASGEMTGYALGAGDASRKLSLFEFHRVRPSATAGQHHFQGGASYMGRAWAQKSSKEYSQKPTKKK
jgi:GT2 family glycosyltransferase